MSSPELLASAFKMLAALAIVLGGLCVVALIAKRYAGIRGGYSKNRMIRVLANSPLGVKKSIALVEVPGSVLVVGITNDNIRLLSQIENKDIVDQLTESVANTTAPTFGDYLQRFTARLAGNQSEK